MVSNYYKKNYCLPAARIYCQINRFRGFVQSLGRFSLFFNNWFCENAPVESTTSQYYGLGILAKRRAHLFLTDWFLSLAVQIWIGMLSNRWSKEKPFLYWSISTVTEKHFYAFFIQTTGGFKNLSVSMWFMLSRGIHLIFYPRTFWKPNSGNMVVAQALQWSFSTRQNSGMHRWRDRSITCLPACPLPAACLSFFGGT